MLIDEARKVFSKEEMALIVKAHQYAKLKHEGVYRESGEEYITHPEAVAYILFGEMHLHDANSIAAAFLHDVIEDTKTTKEEIAKYFNQDVAYLVDGVTKIKDINFTTKNELEQYNTCLLLRKSMEDYRIILIKLADRLHNMRTLEGKKSEAKRQAKSIETLQVFVPLANRTGAYLVKRNLEDLAFKFLNPSDYESCKAMVNDYTIRYQSEIEEIADNVSTFLESNGISNDIRIRFKNLYSLFREMKQNQKMATIHDLIGYEVSVAEAKDCYLTLGHIHECYQNISSYFKDYLYTPKPNGYRCMHTTVCGYKTGFKEHYIQFRISTKKMALLNKYGFAVLKDLFPNKSIKEIQADLAKSDALITALEEIESLYQKDNDQFIKQIYDEVLAEQLNVYSKDGNIYTLPKKATILDFAYKIHTEVGNKAVGAIVNGIEVPLTYGLKNEDRIEVIIDEDKKYQDDYLDYVVTALAKKKIREGLKLTRTRKIDN